MQRQALTLKRPPTTTVWSAVPHTTSSGSTSSSAAVERAILRARPRFFARPLPRTFSFSVTLGWAISGGRSRLGCTTPWPQFSHSRHQSVVQRTPTPWFSTAITSFVPSADHLHF